MAEGLFYYMDQEAGSALLRTMASASTPDSMLIMTHLNHALFTASQRFIADREFPTDEKIKTFYSSWKSGMPEDVSGYLASNSWRVESQELMSDIHKVIFCLHGSVVCTVPGGRELHTDCRAGIRCDAGPVEEHDGNEEEVRAGVGYSGLLGRCGQSKACRHIDLTVLPQFPTTKIMVTESQSLSVPGPVQPCIDVFEQVLGLLVAQHVVIFSVQGT